jgi:AbrB family looped-hinge helix DNA binding protein
MDVHEHVGTVTKKGQVTIPLSVRKLLGVKAYDKVTFRVSEGRVKSLPAHMSLEAAFGAVPLQNCAKLRRIAGQNLRQSRGLDS